MIKLKTQYAGPAGTYPPGSTPSFDTATEKALIEGGFATRVMKEAPPASAKVAAETAAAGPAENAALPHARTGKGPGKEEVKPDKKNKK